MANSPRNKKKIVLITGAALIVVVLLIFLIKWALPYFMMLSDSHIENQFQSWVSSLGEWGHFIILGIFIFRTVVSFIPSKPFEIIAGILYGTWGGLILCIFGTIIGSIIIVWIVKKIKTSLWNKLLKNKFMRKFDFIRDADKMDSMILLLFLPGTPKDIMIYIAAMSNMDMNKYIFLSIIARIPWVLMGTAMGGVLFESWKASLVILGMTMLIGLIGYIYKDKILAFCRKIRDKIKSK